MFFGGEATRERGWSRKTEKKKERKQKRRKERTKKKKKVFLRQKAMISLGVWSLEYLQASLMDPHQH